MPRMRGSMQVPIRCERCGASSTRTGRNQKFCPDCAKESRRIRRIQRRAENVEAARAKERIRQARNRVHRNQKCREWAKANPDKVRAKDRAWAIANPEKIRGYARKRLLDPANKLHANLRSGVYASLKGNKKNGWERLVGYTLEDLRVHLERQFARGMNWGNHGRGKGKWHIDHIVPRAAFTFAAAADPEFRACWALTNLRPLWSTENLSKSAKRTLLL